ncbi:plastid division protein CDP1, chloroplastic isoform X2 [Jatropha curcas]|uniref:plastid division protein CDP1, chloroplastic isoform X2 n=1 Tax=Jatropha curcas TaxID=180498 RepID=UPI0009D70FAF|nr:plastid division protein CDP1, chloroplastic isoform X2 [Jatropha curcas]
MALPNPNPIPTLQVLPSSPSSSCFCLNYINHLHNRDQKHAFPLGFSNTRIAISVSRVFGNADFTITQSIFNAADTRIVDNVPARTSTTTTTTAFVEIPVSCYQLLGVPDQSEKDEIVKAVMQLKSADIEEGYTMDAVISRKELLMDVRDKLLFEPEYAGNVKEKIPPKSSLRIPWAWLPGALCLLQESGEDKLVLDIGREALQCPDSKPYVHDLLLSMALAECAIAKSGFEKNKVSRGFEALARAQCLLRSKISLGKMALLSEIEESLEELAPACTLELLGMPHSPDNAERRRGAIAALRELLRQGLDVETSCRVQDWPCFLSQALHRLMATEIVDLIPWDDLALVRKNKKSIESQNQRIVIDFNCFYVALIAHVAVGFSSKQKELISKAKLISECLMTSEGIDLKFEEALCSFLLGQGTEAQAVEKLHQLELNSNPASRSLLPGKDTKDVSDVKLSLETWLKDAVLVVFPDTRDCSPSMVKFFGDEKRTSGSKRSNEKRISQQINPALDHRLVSDIAMKRMDHVESFSNMNSTQHLGTAVKQLAATDLRSSLLPGKNDSGGNVSEPSVQFERNLSAVHSISWGSWLAQSNLIGKITFVAVLGCFALFSFKLSCMNLRKIRIASKFASSKPRTSNSSLVYTTDPSLDCNAGTAYIRESSVTRRIKKLLGMVKMQFQKESDLRKYKNTELAANLAPRTLSRKQMPAEEAEALVKQWQAIKAEALGPNHEIHSLSKVLDESMLAQMDMVWNSQKLKLSLRKQLSLLMNLSKRTQTIIASIKFITFLKGKKMDHGSFAMVILSRRHDN